MLRHTRVNARGRGFLSLANVALDAATMTPCPAFPPLRMRRGRSSAVDARHARRASAASERPHLAAVRLRRAGLRGADRARCPASAAGASTGSPTGAQGRGRRSAFPASPCSPTRRRALRTDDAREALNPDNLICRAIKAIKDAVPEIGVLTDVALDPYTSHGHDGLTDERGQRAQRRDGRGAGPSRRWSRPRPGADIVAPSDMMDGRVGAIRQALETRRPLRRRDHGLCREICLGLLRPVPRRGRLDGPAEGRQARLSDGPGQRRRGAARGRARHRRGRRHGDGQAGPALSRRARAR